MIISGVYEVNLEDICPAPLLLTEDGRVRKIELNKKKRVCVLFSDSLLMSAL